MARIVITGGAGFIGSHLTDRLLGAGHEVVVVDNLYTGTKGNFVHHRDNPRFEFLRHDVIEPVLIECDQIYHLACPASPVHYQNNPVKTIKTNVMGTINMLGLAKRLGASVLLASTSEVYGDPLEHPQKETYWGNVNPVGPRSCYDEGKRVAETLTESYRTQSRVNTTIVRIFNTYGPRMLFNDGRVVSNFIVQALQGKDITVYGEGEQTRSFCYVDDLVSGFVAALNAPDFHGPVNLGNPNEMTIRELASLVIELVGSKSKLVFKPLPQDDPMRRKPDITLAQEKLGWRPEVVLRDGLERTIRDFDARMKQGEKAA
jgi:UDP-glucuronate decarboxylase